MPIKSCGLFAYDSNLKKLLEKIFAMQKRILKTIRIKRKFDLASYILQAYDLDTVFNYTDIFLNL